MNLGKSIHTCRVKRGLSQAELARRAGCSVSYLSMLENSKRDPTMSTVQSIASGLGVPVEILFFLGAERGELAGIDKELAGQLALTALELLDEQPVN
ncbi:transcriptional regulator with XRE-family HTH domain [Janthinobacterium sp. CG_23.3]|uniref:helix-turn-helix domain-containing protein n=1 Tax=Janthinobacterium sp. CG_23.3 TaxID=3349634 RepID=UPI0038D35EDB